MTRYTIVFTRAAERDFEGLSDRDRVRISRRLDILRDNPRQHGCVKLEGMENLYRIRSGDFRILYTLREALLVITVIRVDNRSDVYRRIGEL